MTDPAILRFKALVEAGLAALEERRQEINDLNVFPVADGDTGDNMVLTMRAVLQELERLEHASMGRSIDEIGRDEIVQSVARAALLGARGNSGVILSQLIRGAAEELVSRPGEMIDPVLIAAALAAASDQAYGSVQQPAEGTILTVVREMARRSSHELAHMETPRLEEGVTTDSEQDAAAAAVMEHALESGQESVKKGPDLLPALREAGVVDAGGYGLTVILAGMVGQLRGDETVQIDHHAAAKITHPEHASETFRFCTNFAASGTGLDSRYFIRQLEQIGDSILVVGDTTTLKVHVHTDDPDAATSLFEAQAATVSHIDIADMNEQVKQRDARLTQAADTSSVRTGRAGVVAVVTGDGFKRLFAGLGVAVLDGGPTLNPSTRDLLAAIHAVPAEEVVVLPNSSNVFMAAERAAELSDKVVRVVRSRALQSGLAAAVAFVTDRGAAENAAAMETVLAEIATGGVARAARDDPQGRFVVGDAIGFVNDELVAWGGPPETLGTVLAQLAEKAELITCLAGADAPLADDEVLELLDAEDVELELEAGGQQSYWWLLSAE